MPVLRGEIELDGKKAILTLRQTQSEVTRTSSAFARASQHSNRFAQSMLLVNSGASATHKALHFLGRAGFVGFAFAAAYKAAEQFAEALNKTGEEAQKSGKLIDSSFKAGRAATTVEGITSEIEKLTEEQKRLEEEAGKFDLQRLFAKGLKSLTGIDIGADILETNAENARKRVENLKALLEQRKKEEEQIKNSRKEVSRLGLEEQRAGIVRRKMILLGAGAKQEEIQEASRSVELEKLKEQELLKQLSIYQKRNKEAQDEKIIDEAKLAIEKQRLKVQEAETTLQEKRVALRKQQLVGAMETTPSVLGVSKAGQQTMRTAERQRAEQVRIENFKAQDKLLQEEANRLSTPTNRITKQDVMNRMAKASAAAANPTLVEKFAAEGGQLSPALIAAQRASGAGVESIESIGMAGKRLGMETTQNQSDFSAQKTTAVFSDVAKAINELISKINSAPLVTSGSGSN